MFLSKSRGWKTEYDPFFLPVFYDLSVSQTGNVSWGGNKKKRNIHVLSDSLKVSLCWKGCLTEDESHACLSI